MAALGEHISATERRAVAAERAAIERYRATLARAMQSAACFPAASAASPISGCSLPCTESGANGLVPISTFARRLLRPATRSRRASSAGAMVASSGSATRSTVRLVEADAIGGRLLFRIDRTSGPAAGAAVAVAAAVDRAAPHRFSHHPVPASGRFRPKLAGHRGGLPRGFGGSSMPMSLRSAAVLAPASLASLALRPRRLRGASAVAGRPDRAVVCPRARRDRRALHCTGVEPQTAPRRRGAAVPARRQFLGDWRRRRRRQNRRSR